MAAAISFSIQLLRRKLEHCFKVKQTVQFRQDRAIKINNTRTVELHGHFDKFKMHKL